MTSDAARRDPARRPGLAALPEVPLSRRHEEMFAVRRRTCGGSEGWIRRKVREARDLFAMAKLGPRLQVLHLDLDVGMIAILKLRVPVPQRKEADGRVTLFEPAVVTLYYPECATSHPQPGSAFIEIIQPKAVFHPSVAPTRPHLLCLGETLPAGVPCKELVLMTYAALAFQSVMLDPREGVMNLEAARYFARNQDRLPLSPEPFLPT